MDLKLRNNSQLALSSGYIPVEYIEATGIPNINTGISQTLNVQTINIECTIEVLSNNGSNTDIYTYYYENARPTFRLRCNGTSDTNFLAYSYQLASTSGTAVEFSGKTHIVHKKTYIEINGVETAMPAAVKGHTPVATLKLFTSDINLRIWNFVVKISDNIVRDYIPVISFQEGRSGEACLYDKVNGVFYYSTSTGSFTASTNVYTKMITAYIKDCPNISGIDLLRRAVNLQRIRCDIGNISGSVTELLRYTALAGFTDDYQEQQIPRIVGTWTLNSWYTNEELENFQGAIDGLTVIGDGIHNVETALENGDFAIQTLDSSKPNYNPAAAIRLAANGYGYITTNRIINNGGKFIISKNDAANITTFPVTVFRGITTVVDENSIVTSDNTQEYDFETFEEFKYFTGLTTIEAGSSTSVLGAFGSCSKLTSIKIPYGVTTIGAYSFYDCTALEGDLIFPDTVTTIGGNSLHNIPNVSNIYIPCNFNNTYVNASNNMSNNVLGKGDGNLIIKGNHNASNVAQVTGLRFIKILEFGNMSAQRYLFSSSATQVRVKGTVTNSSAYGIFYTNGYFFESIGNITGIVFASTGTNNKTICHLGYNNVISSTNFGVGKASNFYVGDGSSRANDEAVLALYLADSNWSGQSAKLATWYDYNGEYKWYYITDNLTNCTNTNPDAWPHITRG